ncbi:MAG: shikimate kinase AroK [Gammaproteobacteria bacterium]
MPIPANIFLVGPMGAGKSTAGRRLAKTTGKIFKDSDQVIQERTGVDIPLIFDIEGEEGFRNRERAVIEELTQLSGIVLATGGGAIMTRDNRTWLGGRGFTIYLHTTPEQSLERTGSDRNRPLLDTDDPGQRLRDLYAVRDPLYREIADLVIDTDGNSVQRMVKAIMDRLESPI